MTSSVLDCRIIELDRHHSHRQGDICVVENGITIPFDVKRVYCIYDVPSGAERGGHAHRDLQQLIVALGGSFTVVVDDGQKKRSFFLNRPDRALYVAPGIWRVLGDFSSGSVCMVLASEKYDVEDYLRDYGAFLDYRNNNG